MSRYIDAVPLENKLIEHKKDEHLNLNKCGYDTWRNAFKIALRELHNTPTADVKPVVRGKVVTTVDEWHVIRQNCSICNEELEYKSYPNFCPHCGADMRGDLK